HVRIETGLGAEGFITDATAGSIQDEALPLLRAANYGAAIELMTLRVAERFAGEYQFQIDSSFHAPEAPRKRIRAPYPRRGPPPFLYIIILFIILSSLNRRGRRRG